MIFTTSIIGINATRLLKFCNDIAANGFLMEDGIDQTDFYKESIDFTN